jgi:hypothetical protein
LLSKIYVTELRNKATKPFWQVTKPYNLVVRQSVPFRWATVSF